MLHASPLPAAAAAAHAPATGLRVIEWQLAPALSLCAGRASRVLLADAVGLGKTIQAGWALTNLCNPSRDRALVLTPAGLRDQWSAELLRLFGVRARVIDAAELRRLRSELPADVNPWSLSGVSVAAIDFAKRPEILAALLDVRWSVVILDEAHGLAARTDRRRAADLVARNADHVLLLTATPHSGDAGAFEDLCRIGSLGGDPMLMFRRGRAEAGMAGVRRVKPIRLAANDCERRMHAGLRRYVRRLRREALLDRASTALIAWVLLKRAASSASALHRTLLRRRRSVAESLPEPAQEPLPFGDEGEYDEDDERLPDAIDLPALRDRVSETETLDQLAVLAAHAAASESKVRHLARLVRRVSEPVIVFTEFRDTLQRVAEVLAREATCAVLHGGLSRAERLDAERTFTRGAARVLLATDAAGEGLNLHHACRIVISLDVPWNPTRMEQRIGRVDRIGQGRRVHALMLIGASRVERLLFHRLIRRQQRLAHDLVAAAVTAGPLDTDPGRARAASVLMETGAALVRAAGRFGTRSTPRAEEGALTRTGRPSGSGVPWTEVRPLLRRRLGLPPGVLIFFSAVTDAGAGPSAPCVPVMVACDAARLWQGRRRALLRQCLHAALPTAAARITTELAVARPTERRRIERQGRRAAAALEELPARTELWQAGLFDRRAMTAALNQRLRDERREAQLRELIERLEAAAAHDPVVRARPVAALVLR